MLKETVPASATLQNATVITIINRVRPSDVNGRRLDKTNKMNMLTNEIRRKWINPRMERTFRIQSYKLYSKIIRINNEKLKSQKII
jgi:hypothetical protein